jgi:hypothetical protein
MVGRINTSKSISKAVNYNEQKVANGKAEYALVSGFIKDINNLNFYGKLHDFARLILLNEKRTRTNIFNNHFDSCNSDKYSK